MNVKQLITQLLEYESDADVSIMLGDFIRGNSEGHQSLTEINIDNSGRVLLAGDYTLGRILVQP